MSRTAIHSRRCKSPTSRARESPNTMPMNTREIAPSLDTLYRELVDGTPPRGECFVLNSGDVGLLRSLDALSAEAASRPTATGSTIATHVEHLRYGLSLLNAWSGGKNPWDDADFSAAWRTPTVSDAEWATLRARLGDEARRWGAALRAERDVNAYELNGLLGSIIHLAYHLGAIRQIDRATRGPIAPG